MATEIPGGKSRRSLLAVGGAAATAVVAATFARPLSGFAATGEPLLIGKNNVTTEIEPGVYPQTELKHEGVYTVLSIRSAGTGDASRNAALDVQSDADFGVGVNGSATSPNGRGVRGNSPGIGVHGNATADGIGVRAETDTGYALETIGRLKIGTSGVATIPAGQASVTVPAGVNVTSGSFVLLTPKANLGGRSLWFTLGEATDTIIIRMSSSRAKVTKVAWLLVG